MEVVIENFLRKIVEIEQHVLVALLPLSIRQVFIVLIDLSVELFLKVFEDESETELQVFFFALVPLHLIEQTQAAGLSAVLDTLKQLWSLHVRLSFDHSLEQVSFILRELKEGFKVSKLKTKDCSQKEGQSLELKF